MNFHRGEMKNERFVKWLQKQMDDAGLNQNELAKKSGLYPSNVSMVLNGDKEPGINFFIKVAKGLHLPPGYVFEQYALSTPQRPGKAQLLAIKVSELMNLFIENGQEAEVQLILEFAEMLLKRQGKLPAVTAIEKAQAELPPVPIPDEEYVLEIIKHLSTHRQRQVYDFARWQLKEEYSARDSSGKRQEIGESKRKEWQEAIGIIDLMLAIEEATPQERERFLTFLIERYQRRHAALSGESPTSLPAIVQMPPE